MSRIRLLAFILVVLFILPVSSSAVMNTNQQSNHNEIVSNSTNLGVNQSFSIESIADLTVIDLVVDDENNIYICFEMNKGNYNSPIRIENYSSNSSEDYITHIFAKFDSNKSLVWAFNSTHLDTVPKMKLTSNQSLVIGSSFVRYSSHTNTGISTFYNQTGTNYDVHKYTTTADVAATFNWGSSGYSGTLAFTNFDDNNPIVDNAGFASFSVAITGTDHTYTGNSTDSLDNSWLGGASVAGALYGDSSPDESGGRVNVNLYKSGDTGTAGANDFYFAEGIYLVD